MYTIAWSFIMFIELLCGQGDLPGFFVGFCLWNTCIYFVIHTGFRLYEGPDIPHQWVVQAPIVSNNNNDTVRKCYTCKWLDLCRYKTYIHSTRQWRSHYKSYWYGKCHGNTRTFRSILLSLSHSCGWHIAVVLMKIDVFALAMSAGNRRARVLHERLDISRTWFLIVTGVM